MKAGLPALIVAVLTSGCVSIPSDVTLSKEQILREEVADSEGWYSYLSRTGEHPVANTPSKVSQVQCRRTTRSTDVTCSYRLHGRSRSQRIEGRIFEKTEQGWQLKVGSGS